MAVWKKVIVSGSTANLAALQVDNLTSGQAVIGGGASNLTTRVISGSGAILASGGSNIVLSGSFSGSFRGDGSGLTGVTAQSAFALTFGEGIGSLGPGVSSSYNGNQPVTIVVSGAVDLTEGRHIKWDNTANKVANSLIYDDGTNLQITGSTIIVSGASSAFIVSGSVRSSGGFTGSLFGTSSWAQNVVTAQTASFINNNSLNQNLSITGSLTVSGSATTELFVLGDQQITGSLRITTGIVAQNVTASFTGSLTGALIGTASWATNATQVANSLNPGLGLSGSGFNGATASIFYISGAAQLTSTLIPKWTGTGLNNSNITDTGTQIQIGAGATSGLSVAAGGVTVSAGGVNVTGNSIFTGNVIVTGTASFQNTDSLFVADKFIALASSSQTLTQGGIIVVSSTTATGMSGSALFLDNVGTQGRFAVTSSLNATASAAIGVNEYLVSVTVNQASDPTTQKPTWGSDTGNTNAGGMWITTAGDIFIYV